ncbi:MAG: tyrosine-type recombinase/integrase [Caulobacteraceae bacterium]
MADATRREPQRENVQRLIWQYKQAPEFLKLRPRTQADYRLFLDKIQEAFGPLSMAAMDAREVARHIFNWRDGMASSPRRADYAVQVLKVLLSWAVKRGLMEHNRAAGVGRIGHSDRRETIWSDAQVEAFLKHAPEPLRRAMILAIETGQRQGDLLALPWSAIRGDVIQLRQAKTGARVAIPISPRLRLCLDSTPRRDGLVVLTKSDGMPWDSKGNGFRSAWWDVCDAAGIKGVTFHDLRGTFVTRRLAEGWTTQEVAMCTGHSLRDLASLDTYADRATIAEATAQRVNARTSGTKT